MRVRLPWAGRGALEWLCPAGQPKPCQMEGGLDWAALPCPSKGDCLKRNPLEERLPDSPRLPAPLFCPFLWQGSYSLPHLRGCEVSTRQKNWKNSSGVSNQVAEGDSVLDALVVG